MGCDWYYPQQGRLTLSADYDIIITAITPDDKIINETTQAILRKGRNLFFHSGYTGSETISLPSMEQKDHEGVDRGHERKIYVRFARLGVIA